MGYAEAIEKQADLLAWFATPSGKTTVRSWIANANVAYDGPATVDGTGVVVQRLQVGLGLGEPFWVGSHIAGLLSAGEESWPDRVALNYIDLPAAHGFAWFETPLPLPARANGEMRPLRAFAWSTYAEFDGMEFVPLQTDGSGDTGVYITFYHQIPDDPLPGVLGMGAFRFGDLVLGDLASDTNAHRRSRLALAARYFQVFCGFVRQRVVTTTRQTVQNRSARKRIARTIKHEPVVQVVELRRREYQQREGSEHAHGEWSCQWMVRGHWHQYHTKEGVQPRWVTPYVKGDPTKPLKIPRTIAYEVVR